MSASGSNSLWSSSTALSGKNILTETDNDKMRERPIPDGAGKRTPEESGTNVRMWAFIFRKERQGCPQKREALLESSLSSLFRKEDTGQPITISDAGGQSGLHAKNMIENRGKVNALELVRGQTQMPSGR